MNNQKQREKALEWVNSPVRENDTFYLHSIPDVQFYALGSRGDKMICSNSKNQEAREYIVTRNNPDIYKKAEDFKGVNPFIETSINFVAFDLSNILHLLGFDRRDTKTWETENIQGVDIPRCNMNPFMLVDGEKHFYQRGNVWNLKQKQALIDTIYKGLEAGRIIVHKHSYEQQVEGLRKGEVISNFDIVDGKQRLTAITEFIQNKFTDRYGNYYSDLADSAKRAFGNYRGIVYGELDEDSTNQQICDAFLNNAVAGTPLSVEHIQFMIDLRNKI